MPCPLWDGIISNRQDDISPPDPFTAPPAFVLRSPFSMQAPTGNYLTSENIVPLQRLYVTAFTFAKTLECSVFCAPFIRTKNSKFSEFLTHISKNTFIPSGF